MSSRNILSKSKLKSLQNQLELEQRAQSLSIPVNISKTKRNIGIEKMTLSLLNESSRKNERRKMASSYALEKKKERASKPILQRAIHKVLKSMGMSKSQFQQNVMNEYRRLERINSSKKSNYLKKSLPNAPFRHNQL